MALTRLDDGVILEVSRSYADWFGYRPEELVGRATLPGDLGLWLDAEQRHCWKEAVERDGETLNFETPLRRKDGSIVTVLISGRVVDLGTDRCVIVAIHDITEQKQHAQHLEEIAHHDSLTGLPNRLLLGDRLRQAIAQNLRAGTRIAVCYLDLDGFKEVNDRLGHEAGDQVLVEVANRLVACVRGGDTVARLGGDEFVVLLSGLAEDEECRMALERLLQTLSMRYLVAGGSEARVSASIGVTMFPTDQADADTLVRHADHSMYAAKQAGKNRYQMFDIRLEQRIEARHATLRGFADALQSGQFRLHYQPKVDCRRGRVVGVEALIRWQHPTLGLLSPAEFVPLIEDTDLASQVGDWVIREALSQIGKWRREGLDIAVSVNAFVRHLLQPGFAEGLGVLLAQYHEAAVARLQIEIVETAALKELDSIRQVIEDCRKLGVAFSLDDFGTGYSTLAHLRHLPATEIKIDQSFVGLMLTRPEDLVIVEAVIGLSRAFGCSVVAEGAETSAHMVRLLELGCDVMQGYALARPMIGDDIPRWVREFRPDPVWYPSADGIGKT
jgi:diguanylate cyclase (GGDEF)-like protein/PAS domain S-box-containing protein